MKPTGAEARATAGTEDGAALRLAGPENLAEGVQGTAAGLIEDGDMGVAPSFWSADRYTRRLFCHSNGVRLARTEAFSLLCSARMHAHDGALQED